MTENQIAFASLQESMRHNLVGEEEAKRANLAREAEANRSALAGENLRAQELTQKTTQEAAELSQKTSQQQKELEQKTAKDAAELQLKIQQLIQETAQKEKDRKVRLKELAETKLHNRIEEWLKKYDIDTKASAQIETAWINSDAHITAAQISAAAAKFGAITAKEATTLAALINQETQKYNIDKKSDTDVTVAAMNNYTNRLNKLDDTGVATKRNAIEKMKSTVQQAYNDGYLSEMHYKTYIEAFGKQGIYLGEATDKRNIKKVWNTSKSLWSDFVKAYKQDSAKLKVGPVTPGDGKPKQPSQHVTGGGATVGGMPAAASK